MEIEHLPGPELDGKANLFQRHGFQASLHRNPKKTKILPNFPRIKNKKTI
jgi:hypothetical protein